MAAMTLVRTRCPGGRRPGCHGRRRPDAPSRRPRNPWRDRHDLPTCTTEGQTRPSDSVTTSSSCDTA